MTIEPFEHLPYRPCVGAMLVNGDGLVFVGQRLDTSSDAWQMPQGGVDPGEDPDVAIFRELNEEIGIAEHHASLIRRSAGQYDYDLPDHLLGKMWGGRYRGQRQRWYLMRFEGQDSDVNIRTKHPEFKAWQWVEPLRLVDLIVPFKRQLYREVVTEFLPHI
jgi:putative (di)nucleoside polyphosphate hydrolase